MKPYVKVNFNDGWANSPDLELYGVERCENFVYEQRGNLYFAVDQDSKQVSYFAYERPGQGYGGHIFTLNMVDGTTRNLIGPWSSRCAVMNEAGFPHSIECSIKGESYRSGAILVDYAIALLEESDEPARIVRNQKHQYIIEDLR